MACCVWWLQIGAFDQIAARIAAGVNQNCGQKAVILAHSMGVNVLLRLLNEPRFKSWRCAASWVGKGVRALPASCVQTPSLGVG